MEDYFSDVVILSLVTQTKRREKMVRMMPKFGISDYRFFDAKTQGTDSRIMSKLITGTQGNLQSNIEIFTETLNLNDDRPLLFFEDDADSILSTESILQEIQRLFILIDKAEEKPDMVYLGKCVDMCSRLELIEDRIYKNSWPLGMHALMIYPKAMREFLSVKEYTANADVIFKELFQQGKLTPWVYHPSLFFQDVEMQSSFRSRNQSMVNCNECRIELESVNWTKFFTSVFGICLLILLFLLLILLVGYFWFVYPSKKK